MKKSNPSCESAEIPVLAVRKAWLWGIGGENRQGKKPSFEKNRILIAIFREMGGEVSTNS